MTTAANALLQNGRAYRAEPTEGNARRRFHRRLPDCTRTSLITAGQIAEHLGISGLLVKDESSRCGLPSFKILGASWATYCALRDLTGITDEAWNTMDELGRLARSRSAVRRLCAATDGNHGRAVARVARWLGLESVIFVPTSTAPARIEAIEAEGATVTVVDGGYGDAVARSAREMSDECLVVSDTSWPGYEDIPRRVIEGYATIFDEVDEDLRAWNVRPPDVVLVQVGVGALAGAAVQHYRAPGRSQPPCLVAVEPSSAACALASATAGHLVTIPGPHESIMAGLNCDTPSRVAWPDVSAGIDLFLAVEDDATRQAMRDIAHAGVVSGETGAAGLAGLTELCIGTAKSVGVELGVGPATTALVLSTEGATNPEAYATIVGDS